MIKVMFHDDWEVFGDGTGNPQTLMFDPAKRLLDICDKYGAKYTFFAEIGQQLTMLGSSNPKWREVTQKWEKVLIDAIQRGHDVQLHFHPQWIGAAYKDDKWIVNRDYWHSAKVPAELFERWIKEGKEYLEKVLKEVNPTYSTLAYRAGGWLCQPSGNIYGSLKNNGIVCDVTLIRGKYAEYGDFGSVDFRETISQVKPWEVDPEDFTKEKPGSGVWELPVYSEITSQSLPFYLLKSSFRPLYYAKIFRSRKLSPGSNTSTIPLTRSSEARPVYGSFGYIHYRHLLKMVEKVQEISKHEKASHFIFLTHSKSFLDFRNFENLLNTLTKKPGIVFCNTRDYIRNHII